MNCPAEFCPHALEAVPADPKVNTLLPLTVVGMPIAPALFVRLPPFREAFSMVADTGEAKPAVVVCPALMWAFPLLPFKRSISPESKLILPVLRDFFKLSQILHEKPSDVFNKCTGVPSE